MGFLMLDKVRAPDERRPTFIVVVGFLCGISACMLSEEGVIPKDFLPLVVFICFLYSVNILTLHKGREVKDILIFFITILVFSDKRSWMFNK